MRARALWVLLLIAVGSCASTPVVAVPQQDGQMTGNVRIRLSSLTPEPTADGRPRAEDYRLTLSIRIEREYALPH